MIFCGLAEPKTYFCLTNLANLPMGEHLVFFQSAAAAEAAGFKLAAPGKMGGTLLDIEHTSLAIRLCRYIDSARHMPALDELARVAALSPSYLHHLFRKIVGITPRGYANIIRVKRIRKALHQENRLSDIIENAGYVSASRFYLEARHYLGMTPSCFRKGGLNMQLSFGMVESSLGNALFASSLRGVCALLFGHCQDLLVGRLYQLFPQATFRRGDRKLNAWGAALVKNAEQEGLNPDLPVDIQRSVLQQRILQMVRTKTAAKSRSTAKKTAAKTRRFKRGQGGVE